MTFHLGLDFGTTGARACVVDASHAIVHQGHIAYPVPGILHPGSGQASTPLDWREALLTLLGRLPVPVATQIHGIAIAATSATVLLCDDELEPISPALLYSDNRAYIEAAALKKIAPPEHTVCSATSGLAKFLWLTRHNDLANAAHFMHQADWLAALLTGLGGMSDYHNALKSGYDAERLCWPDWVLRLPHVHLLPQVIAPGATIATINPSMARHFKINPACTVHAGTTDSIAAFIAADGVTRCAQAFGARAPSICLAVTSDLTGAVGSSSRMAADSINNASGAGVNEPGAAVTSLGTTIVIKLLSEQRIEAAQYGVYSHRYGDMWLVGGASNAGGGVLRQHFSDAQLAELSARIDTASDSPLDYYPLPCPGERFPMNDPVLAPRPARLDTGQVTPRPADDAAFLHGLLQGLSRIEAAGYARLAELGATQLKSVTTCGGGAKNMAWKNMRERLIGVPITEAQHAGAAYGAALLAKRMGIRSGN